MSPLRAWTPAAIFGLGSVLLLGIGAQRDLELRGDLGEAVPKALLGLDARDLTLDPDEERVAGVDDYLLRSYAPRAPEPATRGAAAPPSGVAGAAPRDAGFGLYVGYYGSQAQGRTIHSPKNCLPGGGWEALASSEARVTTGGTAHPVNRYILQREEERVLVLYWYQGRGRVQANEYRVKLDLLRDAALRRRSDEALVRIVVPITGSEDAAFARAAAVAEEVIPAVGSVLPG